MSSSKKPKSCVYSCPAECGETARFVPDSPALACFKEQGVEGYDLVYIADTHNRQVFLFGTPKGAAAQVEVDLAQPVHEQAHQKAAAGEVISYEWSACQGENNCFFQTTLIPLRDQKGQVGSVLGLVKNITDWAYEYHHTRFLKEVGRRTFPQVLLMAREEERRKLSSALHDEIGSSAVILTSLLSMVKDSVSTQDQAQALKDIAALDKQIKDSIERIKNIVVSMRPPNLETVELAEAVRDMVENVTRYRDIKPSFHFEADDELKMSDEVKIVLYRVAQESLNNILKHSQATKMDIYIKRGVKEVTLRITDNGKGFKQNKQRSIDHVGLLSMRDSVAYLGGKFTIKSELGKGTVVEVTCPKIVYGEINR
ncbi:MAG: sensor histidine kinase [Elusimicrobiaceae bacterium]|nr:sensor histidine kinase [Elusimicrobiaceae bacterium]